MRPARQPTLYSRARLLDRLTITMATPWDRASEGYVAEWLPRFTPYHVDLVEELLVEGTAARVLVPCCGTGAEVIGVARELAPGGVVRATDADPVMAAFAESRVRAAGFDGVSVERAAAEDASGGPWDVVLCAFGLWQLDHRTDVLHAWKSALAPHGKVGVLTWGPPDDEDPIELMTKCVREREPTIEIVAPHILSALDSMAAMFDAAGLSLVRHTVLRHTISFASAEGFVAALREARHWHELFARLGEERTAKIISAFYDKVGGPTAPVPWVAPATLAVAAAPGDEIALRSRPSIKVSAPTK